MSSTFEGIDAVKDQLVGRIKPSDLYKRNRLPRAIGGDGRLQPFSRSDGSERQVIPQTVPAFGASIQGTAISADACLALFCPCQRFNLA